MSQKPILMIPGDGIGATFVEKAAELMTLLVPDLQFVRADFGRTSWEYTNEVLPPETEDSIADADHVLCGTAEMEGLQKNDPVDTIVRYNNLFLRAVEYVPLGRLCPKGIDACIVSPVQRVTRQCNEMDSLDGIESTIETVSDDETRFYTACAALVRTRGRSSVTLAVNREVFPHASKMSTHIFGECIKGTGLNRTIMSLTEAAAALAQNPTEMGMVVGDPIVGSALRGEAAGISGGTGLMPETLVGEGLSIYTPPLHAVTDRRDNPTSTYLAASNLLLDIGYIEACMNLRAAIQEAYRAKAITRDVGGKKTHADFTAAVVESLNSM